MPWITKKPSILKSNVTPPCHVTRGTAQRDLLPQGSRSAPKLYYIKSIPPRLPESSKLRRTVLGAGVRRNQRTIHLILILKNRSCYSGVTLAPFYIYPADAIPCTNIIYLYGITYKQTDPPLSIEQNTLTYRTAACIRYQISKLSVNNQIGYRKHQRHIFFSNF